jgi:hypothetical protein
MTPARRPPGRHRSSLPPVDGDNEMTRRVVVCMASLLLVASPSMSGTLGSRDYCPANGRGCGVEIVAPTPQAFCDTGPNGGIRSVPSLDLTGVVSANTLASQSEVSGYSCFVISDASLQHLVLLPGSPAEVSADSVATHLVQDYGGGSATLKLVGLKFGGVHIDSTSRQVDIPGVATLLIGEYTSWKSGMVLNALHLKLADGSFEAIVCSSAGSLQPPSPAQRATWGQVKTIYR